MPKPSKSSLIIALLFSSALPAHAVSPPDWLRAAAASATGTYEPKTEAVVLFDEVREVVDQHGGIKTYGRVAYKILNTDGRSYGTYALYFDSTRSVKRLHGWTIPKNGEAFERGDDKSIDFGGSGGELYSDAGEKMLEMPAADPGSVVGFEYEEEESPEQVQLPWFFQNTIPVQRSSFSVTVPAGWKVESLWRNHAAIEPTVSGNTYSWQVTNVPAIEVVENMPSWRALGGHMAASVVPSNTDLKVRSYTSWQEVAKWYLGVVDGRSSPSDKVEAKARALTAKTPDWVGKLKALAKFAQSDVRYVAIEIGKGGYEPHYPEAVLLNDFGDCKDKALLLNSMLQVVGIRSFLVLASTSRDVIANEFPAMSSFNHAVLAIQVPPDIGLAGSYATVLYNGSRLLIFDPTDSHTPLGQLPYYLQGNRVLIAAPGITAPTQLPLPSPEVNTLLRKGKIEVRADGAIVGEIEERRTGSVAHAVRAAVLGQSAIGQRKYAERFLNTFLDGASLQTYDFVNLSDDDSDLILKYKFESPAYLRRTAGMTVLRPRVLGQKVEIAFEADRKYPLELEFPSLQSDEFDIALPSGFSVEEVPDGADLHNDFAEYASHTDAHEGSVVYSRTYKLKNVFVPTDRLQEMKTFYRAIAADERANVVLKAAP